MFASVRQAFRFLFGPLLALVVSGLLALSGIRPFREAPASMRNDMPAQLASISVLM
jgi:hypothetical protein